MSLLKGPRVVLVTKRRPNRALFRPASDAHCDLEFARDLYEFWREYESMKVKLFVLDVRSTSSPDDFDAGNAADMFYSQPEKAVNTLLLTDGSTSSLHMVEEIATRLKENRSSKERLLGVVLDHGEFSSDALAAAIKGRAWSDPDLAPNLLADRAVLFNELKANNVAPKLMSAVAAKPMGYAEMAEYVDYDRDVLKQSLHQVVRPAAERLGWTHTGEKFTLQYLSGVVARRRDYFHRHAYRRRDEAPYDRLLPLFAAAA